MMKSTVRFLESPDFLCARVEVIVQLLLRTNPTTMRPSTTPTALAALMALMYANDAQPCMCNAFVESPRTPVRNLGIAVPGGRSSSRPTRTRPHRRQNNDLVPLHASSSTGRYDHLHANARPSANPNNRMYTASQAETARAVADQFLEAYLQSLPSLRRHSGDAVIQRSIEAVRRAIASYLMDAGNNIDGSAVGAANVLPSGMSAAALPLSQQDANPSPAQQQQRPTQQLPSAADATSNAQAAVHQAEAALTDYLDGLSSGQSVSTPSSAEAVGAIRSYLDSLAAVENEASSAASDGNGNGVVGKSFGQSSYLQYIDEVCDADDVATSAASAQECTRAIGSYLDALETGSDVEEASTSSAAGTSRIMGYLDSIAAASSSSNEVAAAGSMPTPAGGGGGYLEALSVGQGGDAPSSPPVWASGSTESGSDDTSSSSSFSPAGATPVPYNQDETTINIASSTNIRNIDALNNISGEDGVIARTVHEEDGGDTITETSVTQEGDDTVVTITSTTRIVLPKE